MQKSSSTSQEIDSLKLKLKESFSGFRVLLADDDGFCIDLVSCYLSEVGVFCDAAENGVDALRLAKEKQYNLVILDLNMPILGGFETVELLRTISGYDSIPVIAFTSNYYGLTKSRLRSCGFDALLKKPFEPDDLYAVILECINIVSS